MTPGQGFCWKRATLAPPRALATTAMARSGLRRASCRPWDGTGPGSSSPAVVVVPQAQLQGIGSPPVVGFHGQPLAAPVDTLSPALRGAPGAPVADALVPVALGPGICSGAGPTSSQALRPSVVWVCQTSTHPPTPTHRPLTWSLPGLALALGPHHLGRCGVRTEVPHSYPLTYIATLPDKPFRALADKV